MKNLRKRYLSISLPRGADLIIHAAIILLMIFGTIMIVSVNVGTVFQVSSKTGEVIKNTRVAIDVLIKHGFFVILSYYFMCFFARNYFYWAKKDSFRKLLLIAGAVVIGLLAFALTRNPINGSKAWITFAGVSIQPAEFAKVYLIVLFGYNANFFNNRKVKPGTYLKLPGIFYAVAILLIGLQPDMGTAIVITLIFYVCFMIPVNRSITKWQRIMVLVTIAGALLVIFFIFTKPGLNIMTSIFGNYKADRFTNPANPFAHRYGSGLNLSASLLAISEGGIFGTGLGNSFYKHGYLPAAQTDFILAIIIEETGIIGLGIISLGYGLILYRLFYYAKRIKQDGYRVVLVGTAAYLGIHFILNVGGIGAFLPLTGVPLLFLSSGGTSILSVSILLGICQAIISLYKVQYQRLLKQQQENVVR